MARRNLAVDRTWAPYSPSTPTARDLPPCTNLRGPVTAVVRRLDWCYQTILFMARSLEAATGMTALYSPSTPTAEVSQLFIPFLEVVTESFRWLDWLCPTTRYTAPLF